MREISSQLQQKISIMLIRFIVSNFMSFKEETEFNMLPASGQKRLKEHIYSAGGVDVLKMAAIYGANGAGKSNLVKAMAAMQDVIEREDFNRIKKYKLDKDCVNSPTKFEIEFFLANKIYSYGIYIDDSLILEEWLYESELEIDKLIFERTTVNGKTTIIMSDEYTKSAEDRLRIKLYENELLKDSVSLLKMLAESKESYAKIKDVWHYFDKRFIVLENYDSAYFLNFILITVPGVFNFINEHLCNLNTGIERLEFEVTDIESYFGKGDKKQIDKVKKDLEIVKDGIIVDSDAVYAPFAFWDNDQVKIKSTFSVHKDIDGSDIKFSLEDESDGTQILIEMLPWIYNIINFKNTLVVDEIESSIHVNLLKELISKFSKDNNTKGQLIFTTHESNLLDQEILRQDEIWFAEKSPAGETGFYPLSDYDIRSDLDIRRGYLNGRFGGVPFLANLHDLNWDKYAKEEV